MAFPGPASPGATLAPLRRGSGDPTFQMATDGAIWRTTLLDSGAVSTRVFRTGVASVSAQAWGPGAAEFLEALPAYLGVDDDWSDFTPTEPVVVEAARRAAHLRLGRTGRVLEAVIPAIIEQRVPGADAFRAWRQLLNKYGTPAPGPAPARMRVFPPAEVWRHIPSWEYHRANVDPGRARTVVGCAQRAAALERLTARTPAAAREALTSLPGVGVWTAAEVAQRAFGDADALSVGDYHVPKMIGWTLVGHPMDDDAMVRLLEPMHPHRHRVVRLLEVSGLAYEPRRGPRLPVQHIHAL
ncbi:MAG TPA: DNA-3-methyladenine glycosylase 2 family protein [Mycobacterium sp.]|nr:DNA-3-methyladenine glycosylase 2 family protein [Mycobacterium sp.]